MKFLNYGIIGTSLTWSAVCLIIFKLTFCLWSAGFLPRWFCIVKLFVCLMRLIDALFFRAASNSFFFLPEARDRALLVNEFNLIFVRIIRLIVENAAWKPSRAGRYARRRVKRQQTTAGPSEARRSQTILRHAPNDWTKHTSGPTLPINLGRRNICNEFIISDQWSPAWTYASGPDVPYCTFRQ